MVNRMTEFTDTDCEECGQPNATCACDKLWRLAEARGHVMELTAELATTKALLKGAKQEVEFSMRRQTGLQADLDALRPRMQELSEGRIAADKERDEWRASWSSEVRQKHEIKNSAIDEIRGLRKSLKQSESTCVNCQSAKRHAYSDATTPGFAYTECDLHRLAGKETQPNAIQF